MTWFKVDDAFHAHGKTWIAGNEAVGLWVRLGSWSAQTLTDGFVPDRIVSVYSEGNRDLIGKLVEVGLLDEVEGGYQFHDWCQYQPSKETIRARQAADRERKSGKKSATASDSARNPDGIRSDSKRRGSGEEDKSSSTPDPGRTDSKRNPHGIQAERKRKPVEPEQVADLMSGVRAELIRNIPVQGGNHEQVAS